MPGGGQQLPLDRPPRPWLIAAPLSSPSFFPLCMRRLERELRSANLEVDAVKEEYAREVRTQVRKGKGAERVEGGGGRT